MSIASSVSSNDWPSTRSSYVRSERCASVSASRVGGGLRQAWRHRVGRFRLTEERLTAWGRELRSVHQRLREALQIAEESVRGGAAPESLSADLRLFCRGFCVALAGHHASEDAALFPLVVDQHPELAPVVAKLRQDHSMLAYLLTEFEHAFSGAADTDSLLRHLDGIGAVMETHFRYEERQLVEVLDAIPAGDLDRTTLFGPIA